MDDFATILFRCTEDIHCTREGAHSDDFQRYPLVRHLCEYCRIAMCQKCWHGLKGRSGSVKRCVGSTIPMALANDHYYGHVHNFIVQQKVTWLECAACCTVWSTILVYYLENPYGHLMNEALGSAQGRTHVKGEL